MYGKKAIKREIYQIIIPMILENILQISANLVITAMVGRLLANDISAQGICIRITDTLWCFYKGVAIGATVLIARAYGGGRHQECRKIAEQTMLTELIIVLVFQVVLYFQAPLFLGFFSKDAQILSLAQGYMKTIVFGFPFVVIMTVVTASFQGYGNTKVPMYIAVLMNVVNIVCGYCFIFGAFGIPGMGIKGAAAALVTAQAVGACTGLYLLYKKKGRQDEELRKIYFKELLKVGVVISSVTSLLLILLPRFFMTLMTDKPELQAIGVVYVFVMGFIQIPQNLSRIYNGTIRAMGYKNAPMLVAGFGIWIVRIPLCILAAYGLGLPITAIWIIIAVDQISRFLLSAGLYYRISKKRERTLETA